MSLKRLVLADKQVTDEGTWHQSKMPKTAFPLGKQSGFKVRNPYRWRVVKFSCAGQDYRVLIYYRLDLQKLSAMLGRDDDGDMCVLARYEFHADHPGWHVHTDCAGGQAVSGRTGGLKNCVPSHRGHKRRTAFGVSGDDEAYYCVAKAFGLLERGIFGRQ